MGNHSAFTKRWLKKWKVRLEFAFQKPPAIPRCRSFSAPSFPALGQMQKLPSLAFQVKINSHKPDNMMTVHRSVSFQAGETWRECLFVIHLWSVWLNHLWIKPYFTFQYLHYLIFFPLLWFPQMINLSFWCSWSTLSQHSPCLWCVLGTIHKLCCMFTFSTMKQNQDYSDAKKTTKPSLTYKINFWSTERITRQQREIIVKLIRWDSVLLSFTVQELSNLIFIH